MIVATMILLVSQAQPAMKAARPVTRPPVSRIDTTAQDKARKLSEVRALIARAEQFSATYEPKPGSPSKADLTAAIASAKGEADSVSEMGQIDQMHLQAAMDRLAQLEAMISNVLNKASETEQGIVQNLK